MVISGSTANDTHYVITKYSIWPQEACSITTHNNNARYSVIKMMIIKLLVIFK